MKRFSMLLLVLVLGLSAVNMSYAQAGRMWAGPAFSLNIPMGSDFYGIGYAATARFQYDLSAMMAIGAEVGYANWAGKSITLPFLGTVDGPSFGSIPLRVFGKYYFMPNPPATSAMRWYGIIPIGLNIGTASGAGSSFEVSPGVGVEYPIAAGGRTQLDASVGYYGVFASGSTLSNIYLRVGVNFAIN